MAVNSIPDRIQLIDHLTKNSTNQLTKIDFINNWLVDFTKQDHRPHYSDRFCFNALSITNVQGVRH